MANRINYLISSISDIQSTIRAIDVKIGVLLVLILFPLTNLSKIFSSGTSLLLSNSSWYIYFLFSFFIIIWSMSLLIIIRVISAIDNPAIHIKGYENQLGSFFSAYLFKVTIIDSIYSRKALISKNSIEEQYNAIPKNSEDIERELIFEQMKLVYIRDIKITGFNLSVKLTLAWLLFGVIFYSLYKYYQ